jgi:hypothetical protein
LAVAVAGGIALGLAYDHGVRVVSSADNAARAIAAASLLFGACGLGPTRLLLPRGLRATELLWVLPVGACVAGIALTVLGFAAVPFKLSLAIVLAGGLAFSAVTVRRTGLPERPAMSVVAWPLWVAAMLAAVALVPYFVGGYTTVIGIGSDAPLAVGSADFLQHAYPLAVEPDLPLDRMPLVWRSKYPIYYSLGAVATLSGLQPYETLAPLAAMMAALGAVGIFILVTQLLGAAWWVGGLAMGIAGLDRMVLHTVMHPYFNQTWGYFALPFALVLAWWVIHHRGRREAALLALFLAVGAFAYPLALPIPLVALAVGWLVDRRARRARGEPVAPLRLGRVTRLYRGRRSLAWMIPVGLLLAVPIGGVVEKAASAVAVVVDPNRSLEPWGGDLRGFIPNHQFFSLGWGHGYSLAFAVIVISALYALRGRPAGMRWGLLAVGIFGMAAAVYFRERDFGWYFHFKVLAFVAPLIVAVAVAGMARLRVVGPVLLLAFLVSATQSGRSELEATPPQLRPELLEVRSWVRGLPPDASVRLDADQPLHQWLSYLMSRQRLCSEYPLFNTSYPHVPVSREADYVLIETRFVEPADAEGPPVRQNGRFALYKLKADLPGRENCSRRLVQTVTKITTT